MASVALSPSRALRRPRRLDLRAILGLFLLLVATGGSVVFWSASSTTTRVLMAAHDLPAGATLTSGDLAVARVRVDDAIYQAAVPAAALESVIGKQLSAPVYAHQLLARAEISNHLPLARDQMVLSIPVSADTAAGGRVRAGDVVAVLLTTGRGTPDVRTTVVLPRAMVYDVGDEPGAGGVSSSSSATTGGIQGPNGWMTLVVTQRQAVQLARARWAGQLDVALLPG